MTNLFDELQWRGLVSESTDGLRELFDAQQVTAYIGFDPTASSLHVGSLLTMWLNEVERTARFVVHETSARHPGWFARSVSRADVVILLGRAKADPSASWTEARKKSWQSAA